MRQIQVELGAETGTRYELSIEGDRVEGFRERQSGGIAIKREPLDPDQWIAALTEELRERRSAAPRRATALEGLLR